MTDCGKPVGMYEANVLIASPESATSSSLGGGGGSGIVGFFCCAGIDGAPVEVDVLLFMFANNAARIAASVAAEDDAADDAIAPEVLDIAYGQYLQ